MNRLEKVLHYRVTSKRQNILICLLATSIFALILSVTPRVFPILEPDSLGYLKFFSIRTSFYPKFLMLMESFGATLEQILLVQIVINIIAFFILMFLLFRSKIPLILILTIALALYGNIYSNAFHFSILTESLSFTLIFIILGIFVSISKEFSLVKVILLFSACSILFAIKPSGLPLLIGCFVSLCFLIFKNSKYIYKAILAALVPLLAVISMEHFFSIVIMSQELVYYRFIYMVRRQ